jgi:DNA-binding response OmpR family regulator
VLEIYLSESGYGVYKARNGIEAVDLLKNRDVHLILMDIMMPMMDGIKATLDIRRDNNIPIIFLSAKSQEEDKIKGLEIGADDYITKPFSPQELLARVKAQLRRFTKLNTAPSQQELAIGGLFIDLKSAAVNINGESVKLTPTEFKILSFLAKNQGTVLSVERIYEEVWEQPFLNSESTVMFHISKLRAKIERDPKRPMYLKVVWGKGYMIE